MTRSLTLLIAVAFCTVWSVDQSHAQFRDGRLALSAALVPVQFELSDVDPSIAFNYDDVAYGLVLSRSGLLASVHRGSTTSNGTELDLFDVNLSVRGEFFQDQLEGQPFFVPMLLHSTYRRIRRQESGAEFAAFEYTGIGLGAGLGGRVERGTVRAQAHAVPGIGLATRSFGTSGGRTTLVDVDAEVAFDRLVGEFGLVLGYGFRWQSWRVGGPDAFDAAGSGKVTYDGITQAFRVGLSW